MTNENFRSGVNKPDTVSSLAKRRRRAGNDKIKVTQSDATGTGHEVRRTAFAQAMNQALGSLLTNSDGETPSTKQDAKNN